MKVSKLYYINWDPLSLCFIGEYFGNVKRRAEDGFSQVPWQNSLTFFKNRNAKWCWWNAGECLFKMLNFLIFQNYSYAEMEECVYILDKLRYFKRIL